MAPIMYDKHLSVCNVASVVVAMRYLHRAVLRYNLGLAYIELLVALRFLASDGSRH